MLYGFGFCRIRRFEVLRYLSLKETGSRDMQL